MRRWFQRGSRSERGAVAVMVGILAVVLFAVGALAVDLGNAWARKRSVQKQVDISVQSAGHMLPATLVDTPTSSTPAMIAAYVVQQLDDNKAIQSRDVTAAELLDADYSNGELEFLDGSGNTCVINDAADLCVSMRLHSPPADVDFGMAGVVGVDGTQVQRSARVLVTSGLPPLNKTLPFWLPRGCGFGAAEADTSGGSSSVPGPASPTSSTPTATATASSSPSPSPTAGPTATVGSHVLSGPASFSVAANGTVTISNLQIVNLPPNIDRATIRFYSPDYSFFVDYAVQDGKQITDPLNVPPFTVSSEVTATAGTWHIYGFLQPKGNGHEPTISSNSIVLTVGSSSSPSPSSSPTSSASPSAGSSPTSIPVGCVGQDRGNFGQLESPRKDESNLQKAFALNIAKGLDHRIIPFCQTVGNSCPPEPNKDCGTATSPITGGKPDFESVDGKNCIKGDTGNDGPKTYDGFIGGGDIPVGRLDASNGQTRCPNGRHTRTNVAIGGKSINNDVLSCYLRGSYQLSDIAQPSGVTPAMLDQSVTDSPRFVWLPVVFANDRAQKNYQPILEFVPAFITDETQTSAATSDNGLEIVGSSIKVLTLFVFNKDALSPEEQYDSVDYDPTLGTPIARLVE